MNTQRVPRARLGLLVTAVVGFGSLSIAGAAKAELPSTDDQIVLPHQGPGTGSVKTPPFFDAAYYAYLSQPVDSGSGMYFHTISGESISWISPVGPGPWSPKAPGDH